MAVKEILLSDRIKGALVGLMVGDALGVPVEFKSRHELKENPVVDMRAFGVHHQPAGTWSDDSSMMLCNLHSLLEKGIDNRDLMEKFYAWYSQGYMTPHGNVFDMGISTGQVLRAFGSGGSYDGCGGTSEQSNGNGSLMRLLPLSLFLHSKSAEEIIGESFANSSLTHAHLRSKICCAYFSLMLQKLLLGQNQLEAMAYSSRAIEPYLGSEKEELQAILDGSILNVPGERICGDGYVKHCLEASLYCLANSSDYKQAVLKAVNLGDDTDTTAAVTGALAGALYGIEAIPQDWINQLSRKEEVEVWLENFTDLVISSS